MPAPNRRFSAFLVVAAVGVCATGCARPERPSAAPAIMRIGIGVPKEAARSGASFVIGALSAETWLTPKPDGTQSDKLVTGWKWDDSRTKLELTLRKDVVFHDGTPWSSEVGVGALQQSIKDREAFSFSSIKSIAAKDPYTMEVGLSEPNSFVLPDLALTTVKLPANPDIGTGPFQKVSSNDQQTVFRAFPRYYRGRPALDEIDLNKYPTQRGAWAALMRGEIDMLHEVSRDAADFVQAESIVRTYSFPRPYYIPLVFSVRHPILKQAQVRIAINEALDRAALVKEGMNGRGTPADSPVWPRHWAYSPPAQPFAFNPESARRRLDAAGWPIRKRSGDLAPMRFSFTCLVWADDARFERLATLVQKQLADAGIDMQLVALPQKQLVGRLAKGDFDAFIFEMAGRSLSWVYEFWRSHEESINNTGYRAADAALDRLRAAATDDEVRAGVAELTRVLHDDPPAAFLAWQETTRAVSIKFNVAAERDRDILTTIWQWRRADTAKQASR